MNTTDHTTEHIPNPQPGEPAPKRRGRKALVITAIVAGAVLLVGGASTALAFALGGFGTTTIGQQPVIGGPSTTPGTPGATTDPSAGPGPSAAGPVDASVFIAAMDAAVSAVNGVGVQSIDREHDGFEVEVQVSDGSDVTVYVGSDGSTQVHGDDDGPEDSPDPLLTADDVEAIVAAVTAYAPNATIEEITTSDDGSPFEVTIRDADGRETEIDVAADYTLTVTEVDTPDDD